MIQGFRSQPSIWESERWYERLGMETKASGVGFDEAQVDKVSALPLGELMEYAGHVAKSAEDYVKSLRDEDLDHVPDPARPRRTMAVNLRSFLVAHGWWHTGEIKYLKGLQGMPFAY